ncbi:MAG: hypothetical protein E6H03_13050 [Bacillati bacterium ANGP1]|uniref:Uncharacterized protein n=1 Tax=Candidatus Segetimicrobium genomatis TaxID=2569760 RepID=A0A537J2Z8_9BACT|nr:MAG: hypothetical protein E6H03_13050 [Terrabacteria group bacterium ANGP1]
MVRTAWRRVYRAQRPAMQPVTRDALRLESTPARRRTVTGIGARDGTVAAPGRGWRVMRFGRLIRRETFPWLT